MPTKVIIIPYAAAWGIILMSNHPWSQRTQCMNLTDGVIKTEKKDNSGEGGYEFYISWKVS